MIQLTEDNRPKCEKCGVNAITVMNGVYLCGDCLVKFNDKLREQNRRLILEE